MSVCWFCYWGWPRQVREIYQRAEADIDALYPWACQANNWTDGGIGGTVIGESALQYGPGHVVWADENFGRGTIEACLRDAKDGKGWHSDPEETPAIKAIVIRSLDELLALPDSILDPVPAGYYTDDDHPESYPPSSGLMMTK